MQKNNPAEELADLDRIARQQGLDVEIGFEGQDGDIKFTYSGMPSDATLQIRFMAIGREILDTEIGMDWAEGQGATGRIRINGDGVPWLDADGREEDWLYERSPELDDEEWANPANVLPPEVADWVVARQPARLEPGDAGEPDGP